MYADLPGKATGAAANSILQEHPVLRKLDKPDKDTGGRADFTVSTAKDLFLGFDEVYSPKP
jgi:hypothetical protein